MVWDETSPSGSDAIKFGDDKIRELKTDVRSALSEEHEALTDNASAPTARHKFPSGTTAARPAADADIRRIYLNSTTYAINVENLGLSLPAGSPAWSDYGAPLFQGGGVVKMVFFMAAAPTGWTQVTTYNDYALRVVSGAGGGTGGSAGFSAAFSIAAEAAHTHTGTTATATFGTQGVTTGGATNVLDGTAGGSHDHTFTTSAGSSHTHTISTPYYADCIIASKD